MPRYFAFLFLIITAPAVLSACSQTTPVTSNTAGDKTAVVDMAVVDPKALYPEVLIEAKELQGKLVDGWIDGEFPRTFKTDYARTTPEEKAQFSVDYVSFVKTSGQDMERNWQSYLPYSKREKFARLWFSDAKHDSEFLKQTPWHQLMWLHEAILDGGELWFRAFEKKDEAMVTSTAAMTHDAEQDMVDKFKENERSPARSFSEMPVPHGSNPLSANGAGKS